MQPAFYNDNDAYAARWLRNLVSAGHLPAGTIDHRSILDLDPAELRPFRQCHFFAGIGGWPLALSLAGWPADREVWTGSCPCQPLSSAGQRKGHADQRHLWPAFQRLIAECRPATVFGEQVASKDGREWLAGVRADLEHLGYAVGAADLPAAGVGAPHIRQRLFWVADAGKQRYQPDVRGVAGGEGPENGARHQPSAMPLNHGATGGVGDAAGPRRVGPIAEPESQTRDEARLRGTGEPSPTGGMADHNPGRCQSIPQPHVGASTGQQTSRWMDADGCGATGWADSVWLPCLDGKARRTQPSLFPLADGAPSRVGRLRAYGNAITPQAAATFIQAFLDSNLKG